jgi:hypothetical protein
MAYIGNTPAESFASFETETFTVSATTNYTLSHSVTNENEIRLVINGVVQQPGSGKAYTASGTTLTLSSATASGDSMYAVYLGRALQTVNPPNASVGTAQLASEAVTNAKVAPTIITGQTAETSIATDDLILLSDTSASGALKKMTRANFVSGIGGTNTPAFSVTLSGTQSCSNNTSTVIVFNSEHYDTDSAYDTSNGRFTVPSGEGGKYAFFVSLRFDQTTSNRNAVDIRINNSSNTQQVAFENAGPQYTTIGGAVSINLSAGDYVYAEYYQSSGGTIDVRTDSHFSGFKLI